MTRDRIDLGRAEVIIQPLSRSLLTSDVKMYVQIYNLATPKRNLTVGNK